ncbi:MerR family transcriptional regulator [Micromonospora fluostatini]|uniref:MerR family transcriptional regulator n=1 Tax=Micromonospora sp. JCM 30529 TaxID=3421643 RepID=UPI003D1846C6
MRIGDLAASAGVSVRALRYYEEQGLLTSVRSPGGQRRYADRDVARVLLIQRLYQAGLSSRTIVDLLPCTETPSHEASDLAFERMRQERDRITGHIAELTRTRDALDRLLAANRAHREGLVPG